MGVVSDVGSVGGRLSGPLRAEVGDLRHNVSSQALTCRQNRVAGLNSLSWMPMVGCFRWS